jgi:hypothetical protein
MAADRHIGMMERFRLKEFIHAVPRPFPTGARLPDAAERRYHHGDDLVFSPTKPNSSASAVLPNGLGIASPGCSRCAFIVIVAAQSSLPIARVEVRARVWNYLLGRSWMGSDHKEIRNVEARDPGVFDARD